MATNDDRFSRRPSYPIGSAIPADPAPAPITSGARLRERLGAIVDPNQAGSLFDAGALADDVIPALPAAGAGAGTVARTAFAARAGGFGTAARASARPSAMTAAGTGASIGAPTTLALATNARDDELSTVPQNPYQPGSSGGPSRRFRSTSGLTQAPPGTENTFSAGGVTRRVKGGAAPPTNVPPTQVAAINDQSDRIQLRGRQGAIIKNPDAMSTTDRLRMIASDSSFKGSPSMRRAAADAVLAEAAAEDANYQTALAENASQDLAQAGLQARSREAFADRRLSTDQFNVETSETRREADRTNELRRGDQMLSATRLGAEMQAAGQQRVSDRYDKIVADYMERNPDVDYSTAAQYAANVAASEGVDPQSTPVTRGGESVATGNLEDSLRGAEGSNPFSRARRWIDNRIRGYDDGSGRTEGGFDPANYKAEEQGIVGRLQSYVPGGVSPDDVVVTDRATGRVRAIPRSALGGLSVDAFNRRNLERRNTRGE